MTKESIPVRTILVEENKVKVSKDSPPVKPIILTTTQFPSYVREQYEQALDKFKRGAIEVGNPEILDTLEQGSRYFRLRIDGIYSVEDKGLVYTVEQKMTEGWVPSYNDPDNAGCHPNAELIEVAILSFSPPEVKPEQQEVQTEKPDFEAMGLEVYGSHCEKGHHNFGCRCVAYQEGAERIWKDHVEPLKLKSDKEWLVQCRAKEQAIKMWEDSQSELKQAKEENEKLKEYWDVALKQEKFLTKTCGNLRDKIKDLEEKLNAGN